MATKHKDQPAFSWKIASPQTISLFIAGIYISGFLVLNAHLSDRGFFSLELANSRYLTAGVLFAVFLLFWFAFAGRATIGQEQMASAEINSVTERGLGAIWQALIVIKSFIRIVACICASAALFSLMVLGNNEGTLRFILYLIPIVLILASITSACRTLNSPRLGQVFDFGTIFVPIPVYFTMFSIESMTMSVFIVFAAMSLTAKLVFHLVTANLAGSATIFGPAAFLVLYSVLFGQLQYDQVPAAFGGGRPHEVEFIITDETVSSVLKDMGIAVEPVLNAKLIYESRQEFFVDIEGESLRLSRNAVAGFRVLPIEDDHWLLRKLPRSPDTQR